MPTSDITVKLSAKHAGYGFGLVDGIVQRFDEKYLVVFSPSKTPFTEVEALAAIEAFADDDGNAYWINAIHGDAINLSCCELRPLANPSPWVYHYAARFARPPMGTWLYAGKSNADLLLIPARVHWDPLEHVEPCERDKFGNAIANSAGTVFYPSEAIPKYAGIFTIKKFVDGESYDQSYSNQFIGKLNDDTPTIPALGAVPYPRQLLCRRIGPSAEFVPANAAVGAPSGMSTLGPIEVTWVLEFRPETVVIGGTTYAIGFDRPIRDQGFEAWWTDGTTPQLGRLVSGATMQPIAQPALLHNGQPITGSKYGIWYAKNKTGFHDNPTALPSTVHVMNAGSGLPDFLLYQRLLDIPFNSGGYAIGCAL